MHNAYTPTLIVISFLTIVVWGCQHRPTADATAEQPPRTLCRVKTTPVKNQGQSELCWVYAMLATIESEHLMRGDSVNLSTDFVARQVLHNRLRRYFLARGQQLLHLRGTCSELLDYLQRYGLTHYDSFHSSVNYAVLLRKLQRTADVCLSQHKGLRQMERETEQMLSEQIHWPLTHVFMLGAEYTPQEFAHSVCRGDEYEAFTSFTHHPFGRTVQLEIPDNHGYCFMNVPLDSLMARIDTSLRSGHAVCWEGDTSEPKFSFAGGIARLDDENHRITAAQRQEMFEQLLTTDDHSMELIGIALTRKGRKYYICKNSWGEDNPYKGFMYMSENYLRAKTIAVWINRAQDDLFRTKH